MSKELDRMEAEVTRHIGCRIKFYARVGTYHLGRIEACQKDEELNTVWIWVKPEDPAVSNPWPRLKLTPSNVVEIVDNPHGYQPQENSVP